MIEQLPANGADVNLCTEHNQTALYSAAQHGNIECAKVLVAAGTDVNVINRGGVSSLHVTITQKQTAVMQLLLDNGAAAVIDNI
jgi:ankyrin repeat protein